MKVEIETRAEENLERYDYRDYLKITVNGKVELQISDGEPEDSNLSRDFSGCYGIPSLMKMAFDAGKNGESFELFEKKGE